MKATEHLFKEHEKISAMLRGFEQLCQQLRQGETIPLEHQESFLQFFELYSDQIHHRKEEEVLLPALIQSGFPWKGGPYCSFFKQMQMLEESISEQIRELDQKFDLKLKHDTDPFSPQRSLPVLEEHVLGRALVKILRLQLGKEDFLVYARRFISLLDAHIDKENRCLLPMLNDTFKNQAQEEMTIQFQKIDDEASHQKHFQIHSRHWEELLKIYKSKEG